MPPRLARVPARWGIAVAIFLASFSSLVACASHTVSSRAPSPAPAPSAAEKDDERLLGVRSAEPTDAESEEGGPGWLGVQLAAVAPGQPGVLVQDVVPDSPASAAGLTSGDVILSVDSEPVNEPRALVAKISGKSAGQRAALALSRGGSPHLVAVRLGAVPNTDELMRKAYVGSQAPSLGSLKTVQGNIEPSLGKLRGNVVVVEFWATWCAVCRMMVPVMNEWHERYAAQGVRVLGVTSENVLSAAQGARSFGMAYPVASDESGRTTLAFRALALPTVFLIDQNGTVREVMVGYSGKRLAELENKIRELVNQG